MRKRTPNDQHHLEGVTVLNMLAASKERYGSLYNKSMCRRWRMHKKQKRINDSLIAQSTSYSCTSTVVQSCHLHKNLIAVHSRTFHEVKQEKTFSNTHGVEK